MGYEYHGKKQTLVSGPYPDQQWPMSGSVTFSDTQAIVDVGGHKRLTLSDTGPLVLRDEEGNAGITLNNDTSVTFAAGITATGTIVGSNFSGTSTGANTGDQNIANLAVTGSSVLFNQISASSFSTTGDITASGNISASGTSHFLNLPTIEPLTTGSLWLSGSGGGAASGSGYVMVAGIHTV